MSFRLTDYVGGKQFRSRCLKCGELLVWSEGDEGVHMVLLQNSDIGVMCRECYENIRKSRARKPS